MVRMFTSCSHNAALVEAIQASVEARILYLSALQLCNMVCDLGQYGIIQAS